VVNKFDPHLEMNIVKDSNPMLNNISSLPWVVGIEILIFVIVIFHYCCTLYMMRLFTESFDDWREKVERMGMNNQKNFVK